MILNLMTILRGKNLTECKGPHVICIVFLFPLDSVTMKRNPVSQS